MQWPVPVVSTSVAGCGESSSREGGVWGGGEEGVGGGGEEAVSGAQTSQAWGGVLVS